ncbi:hypothetical protein [Lysinibacillus parviboronicapiens]|uniref:hypothetical protein n=1 Tax=Lysinibacillus parviboronicapiens TaxID=436516 RepID=UPI000D36DB30|nr:hypothetical protein [Lysinibacillus parviboronicapiens]
MLKKVKGRYILFSQQEHEMVQLDFTHTQIEKFIGMWEADFSINLIYRKLNIHKVSAALIAMDLELLGVIKPRKHGLIGKRLDGDYDDWFEGFKKNKESGLLWKEKMVS